RFIQSQLSKNHNPMSLVTDIDYLIHRLRISQLRAEDRVAGRMLRFDLDLVELNDYIKTTSTSYPEMRYCSSPDIIPGLPDAPLLAYRQYSAYPPLASSSPRARATPSNSEAIERNGVSAGNSALLRTPLPPGTKTPYEKPGVKDLLLIYSSIKGETSEFLKPSTHPLNPLESAVPSPSNSGNHSSPSASILNSATQVGLDFSPTVTTEFDSTSDIVLTDDNVVRGPQRLSTIPASLIRSPQFSLDSDGDDDDIELDYDEVKRM
ncbi:Component of a membrane-bound complex containing the Tor2p kinase, partial [Massospora cicadina]